MLSSHPICIVILYRVLFLPPLTLAKARDVMGGREPLYSTERWQDACTNMNSFNGGRKLTINTGSMCSSPLAWSDGVSMSELPSSPSLLATIDSNVDKALYHNLVEMIPLVETFMDHKQSNTTLRRHAPLVYTPAPRGYLTGQKADDHSSSNKKGHRRHIRDNQEGSVATIAQLQSQMEDLELKLQEKESQLQLAETASKQQTDLLCLLQANIEELQSQILTKEREVATTKKELSEAQLAVASLDTLLENAEADIKASDMEVAKMHEDSQSLQCQVAAFLLWMESISSSLDCNQKVDQSEILLKAITPTVVENGHVDQSSAFQYHTDVDQVASGKRKYLASLIAAKHYPSAEMLLLVAELRGQLQSHVLPHYSTCTKCDSYNLGGACKTVFH